MTTKNVTKKTTNTTKNKTKSATKSTAKSAAYNSRNTTKNNPNPAGKKKKRRRRRKKKTGLVVMIATGVVFAGALAAYSGIAIYYNKHFFPNSTVNGEDVSGKSLEDARQVIATSDAVYKLDVVTRTGVTYSLSGDDFGYEKKTSANVDEFLDKQTGFAWPSQVKKKHDYKIEVETSYDEDALNVVVDSLACFDAEKQVAPTNATIEKSGGEIYVVEETKGDTLIKDVAVSKIIEAVSEGATSVVLTDDCYVAPKITSTSSEITEVMDKVKLYSEVEITYTIGEEEEVLTSDEITKWINVEDTNGDKVMEVTLNENGPVDFVQSLASKYNTYADKRKFKTSKGDVIEIGGGDYGWIVDKQGECKKIIEDIKAGKSVTREPVFEQRAKAFGENDIGNTYVEVDYSNQHMYYYKEGKLVFESDVVTGNINRNNGSPDGVFKIAYKKSPATLVGEGYSSDVSYFMVFAYNVGFHDATWRGSFGGQIYKSNGSHGCVNMPLSGAKELYQILETETPVVAYYREPVKLTAENAKISNAYSYAG